MMKLKNIFLSILAILALSSCTKDENGAQKQPPLPEEYNYLAIEGAAENGRKAITFSIDAGEKAVSILVKGEWTLQIPASCDWLTADPASGKTDKMETVEIKLQTTHNDQPAERKADLTFTCGGVSSKSVIAVTQTKGEAMPGGAMQFLHAKATVTGVKGTYKLPFATEDVTEFDVTSSESWAKVSVKDNDVIVEVDATDKDRTTEIKLSQKGSATAGASMSLQQLGVTATADLLDVSFADNGNATDISMTKNKIYSFLGEKLKIERNRTYGFNQAIFSHDYNGAPSVNDGIYTIPEFPMRPKLDDGYTLEAYVMCGMEPVGNGKESKAFSSTKSGGTAIMIHGKDKDLSFLFCGATEPTDAKQWNWVQSGVVPEPGVWYHVVGSYDKVSGMARIFINGEMKKEAKFENIKMHYSTLGETAFWTIGANSTSGSAEAPKLGNSWNGGIAAVRIYSDALTPEQIKATEINLYQDKIKFEDQ